MDYEKKYKNALEWARQVMNGKTGFIRKEVEEIFPELKESEDEQHRKWILEYLYDGLRKSDEQFKDQFKSAIAWLKEQGQVKESSIPQHENKTCEENSNSLTSDGEKIRKALIRFHNSTIDIDGIKGEDIIAWIEKQGEKPQAKSALEAIKEEVVDNANKVESKFHKGKWVVINGFTILITDVRDDLYETIFVNGEYRIYDTNVIDKDAHLWSIKDAKDGDILMGKFGAFIYKGVIDKSHNMERPYAYGGICSEHYFDISRYNNGWSSSPVLPATKEQRDLLFSKMREAGYEWNAEKKELRKVKQKPTWTEEDEQGYENVDWCINKALQACNDEENEAGTCWFAQRWVNSIKERLGGEK